MVITVAVANIKYLLMGHDAFVLFPEPYKNYVKVFFHNQYDSCALRNFVAT